MNFQVTLIDGTFDLISFISIISYDNDMITFYSEKCNYTYSYHLGVIKNFQTVDNVTYEYLLYCDECNNLKSTQKF